MVLTLLALILVESAGEVNHRFDRDFWEIVNVFALPEKEGQY